MSVQNKNKLDRVVTLGGKITYMTDQYTTNLVHKINADPLYGLMYCYLQGEGIACPGCGLKEASHPLSHAAYSFSTSSDYTMSQNDTFYDVL